MKPIILALLSVVAFTIAWCWPDFVRMRRHVPGEKTALSYLYWVAACVVFAVVYVLARYRFAL